MNSIFFYSDWFYQFTLNGVLRLAYILNRTLSSLFPSSAYPLFSFLLSSLIDYFWLPNSSVHAAYLPFYLNLWRYRNRVYIWRAGVKYRLHGPVCGNWISPTRSNGKVPHAKHTTCAKSRFSNGNPKTRRQPSSVYFIFKPQPLFSTVVVG